jgi:hypothetical protein
MIMPRWSKQTRLLAWAFPASLLFALTWLTVYRLTTPAGRHNILHNCQTADACSQPEPTANPWVVTVTLAIGALAVLASTANLMLTILGKRLT